MKFARLFTQKGLSLERLAALAEVEAAGGIANAAPEDDSRQSLLSRQLAELESFFHVELKRKDGKTIRLTPEGRKLARFARQHLQALEDFHRTCRQEPAEIVLGAGDSLLQWLVLPRLRQLRQNLPGAVFELQDLQNLAISHQLLDQSIDFGLLRADLLKREKKPRRKKGGQSLVELEPEPEPATAEPAAPKKPSTFPLDGVSLGKFGYSLFIPDKLFPRDRKTDATELFEKLPLATQGGNTLFQRRLAGAAAKEGWKYHPQLLCESFPQAAQVLASGDMMVILPDLARLNIPFDSVWVYPLKSLEGLRREVFLAWHKHRLATHDHLNQVSLQLAKVLKFTC